MKEMISAAEAARITGWSKSKVQQHIKQGRWSFARYYPGKKGKGSYEIPARKLYEHIGKDFPEETD